MKKIENYLFDIIGLILPGFIFVVLIVALFVSFNYMDNPTSSIIEFNKIKELPIISDVLSNDKLTVTLTILIVLIFYIIGNIIKVFSKITYEFLVVMFDGMLVPIVCYIFKKIVELLVLILSTILRYSNCELDDEMKKGMETFLFDDKKREKIISNYNVDSNKEDVDSNKEDNNFITHVFLIYIQIYNYIIKILKDIFLFKPLNNFDYENKMNEKAAIDLFNKIYNQKANFKWYDFYKVSNCIFAHEKINTLVNTFMSKYNMYRSFSFIFIINFINLKVFEVQYPNIIDFNILYFINFIIWFAFHSKYKRYWRLAGNEALMNVYTNLLNKKIAQNKKIVQNQKEDTKKDE